MTSTNPGRLVKTNTASYLILGILALTVGGALWTYGQQLRLVSELSGSLFSTPDGSGQVVAGSILALIGTVLVLIGISNVASNTELAAFHAVAATAHRNAEATAVAELPRRPPAVSTVERGDSTSLARER